MTIKKQILIQEEIKRRLKSANACYHLAHNLLPSRLLSKNIILRVEHRPRVLRRILGLKRNLVTGCWRELHEELHNLYSSPSIMRMIKSMKMRWAVHVA
jgi:hypothetical protein